MHIRPAPTVPSFRLPNTHDLSTTIRQCEHGTDFRPDARVRAAGKPTRSFRQAHACASNLEALPMNDAPSRATSDMRSPSRLRRHDRSRAHGFTDAWDRRLTTVLSSRTPASEAPLVDGLLQHTVGRQCPRHHLAFSLVLTFDVYWHLRTHGTLIPRAAP